MYIAGFPIRFFRLRFDRPSRSSRVPLQPARRLGTVTLLIGLSQHFRKPQRNYIDDVETTARLIRLKCSFNFDSAFCCSFVTFLTPVFYNLIWAAAVWIEVLFSLHALPQMLVWTDFCLGRAHSCLALFFLLQHVHK